MPKKFKNVLFISLIVFLISSGTLLALIFYPQIFKPQVGGNFELIQNNQPWDFQTHAKKINILYFGYTQCPDVCPMSMSVASQLFQKLSAQEQSEVNMIFVNVDTEHDSAENTTKYVTQFNSQFIGLFGNKKQIDPVVHQFQASYFVEENKNSYLGYSIAHTDRFFILNKKGYVINMIPSPRDANLVYQKIKELL